MRPVVVVVPLTGRQDPAEVGQVADEGAVEKLAAASADPYAGAPSRPDLERLFFLDDEDTALVGQRRGIT